MYPVIDDPLFDLGAVEVNFTLAESYAMVGEDGADGGPAAFIVSVTGLDKPKIF